MQSAMSDPFGTLRVMAKKRSLGGMFAAAVLVLSACSGGDPEPALAAGVPDCVEGEAWVEELAECRPILVASVDEDSATSTTTSTTTTTTEAVAPTTSIVTGEPAEFALTWADEGSVEADIEQAFWRANTARRQAIEAQDADDAVFVDSHTGRELERQLEAFVLDAEQGVTYRYPEPTDTLIEFIALVTPTEALMQVCELTRSEYYINGELVDERDGDSQFQARFVLEDDGVWRWEERIRLKFEPLVGEVPTCMLASQS